MKKMSVFDVLCVCFDVVKHQNKLMLQGIKILKYNLIEL